MAAADTGGRGMMDGILSYKEALGLLSIILTCAGFGVYFRDILRKKTKPHAFSWIVWGLLSAIAFLAQRSGEAGAGSWALGAVTAACFISAGFAIARGEKDIKRSDVVAFVTALTAIPLWYFTGDPLWAVVVVSMIEVLAFYPTFRKSFHKPHEETAFMYGLDAVKFALAFGAMENYSLANTLYPLVIVMTDSTFVAMVLWRRAAVAKRRVEGDENSGPTR